MVISAALTPIILLFLLQAITLGFYMKQDFNINNYYQLVSQLTKLIPATSEDNLIVTTDNCNENISKFLIQYLSFKHSLTLITFDDLNNTTDNLYSYNIWISLTEDVHKPLRILSLNHFNIATKIIILVCSTCSEIQRQCQEDLISNMNYIILDINANTCIDTSINITATQLEISAFHCPPFVSAKNGSVTDGLEYRIIKEITRRQNWTQRYTILDIKTVPRSLYKEVIDAITERRADIGMCSQWISVVRNRPLEISHPYTSVCLSFLVPKPKLLPKVTFVFQPLQLTLWLAWLSLMAIIIPWLTHCITGISYGHCLLDVLRVSTLNVLPLNYIYQSGIHRILFCSWCVTCLLINTAYSTGFTSLLTSPRYTKPILSVRDMIDQDIKWGGPNWGSLDIMVDTKRAELSGLMDNYHVFNKSDYNKLIRTMQYAIFAKVLRERYIEEAEYLDEFGRTHLMVLRKCLMNSHIAFLLQKNSRYKTIVDEYLRRLFETGLIIHWHARSRYSRKLKYMDNFYTRYVKLDRERKESSIKDLQGAFYVLLIGHCFAFVAFIFELLHCCL